MSNGAHGASDQVCSPQPTSAESSTSTVEPSIDGSRLGALSRSEQEGRKQTTDLMLSQLSALSTRRDDEGNHQIVEFITKEDICRMVDVNPRTVQRWVASGELPCIKLNHNANSPIRFRIEDVDRFLLSRMRQAKEAQDGTGKPSADPTTAPTDK